MSELQRYRHLNAPCCRSYGWLAEKPDGEWMRFEDHSAARAADKERIELLEAQVIELDRRYAKDKQDADGDPASLCNVCKGMIRYGERHTTCGIAVMKLEARIEELEAQRASYPKVCPWTNREFFMLIEHPELGHCATYGGPFDSYTIPAPDEDGQLRMERYEHDRGEWIEGGEPFPMVAIGDEEHASLQERIELLQRAVEWLSNCGAIKIIDGGTYFYGNLAAGNVPDDLVEILKAVKP